MMKIKNLLIFNRTHTADALGAICAFLLFFNIFVANYIICVRIFVLYVTLHL